MQEFKEKDVILSFDYELFFGDNSGTIQKSIIEPTKLILETLKQINGKAVFFIDYLMIKKMLKENSTTKEEAFKLIRQIKQIILQGSRIELHLHPHWIDAKYIEGRWNFSDFSHYTLHSVDKTEVDKLFIEGVIFLEKIAREVKPDYSLSSYRAGGWAINPFYHLREAFIKSGIKYDSSVMSGRIIKTEEYCVDFTFAPPKEYYFFNNDVLQEDIKGEFVEFPISSYKLSVWDTIKIYVYYKISGKKYNKLADGSHYRSQSYNKKKPTFNRIIRRFINIFSERNFSISNIEPRFLEKAIRSSKKSLIVICSHPKDMTNITSKNILLLSKYFNFKFYNEIL